MKKIIYTALILILILGTSTCSFDSKQSEKPYELPPGYVYVNFNIPSGISRSAPNYNQYDDGSLSKTFKLYAKQSTASDYELKTSGPFPTINEFNQNISQNRVALPSGTYDFLVTVEVSYQEQNFVALVGNVTNFALSIDNKSVSISLRERKATDILPVTADIWNNVIGGVELILNYNGSPTNVYGGLCTLNGTDFIYQTGYSKTTPLTASGNQIIINETSLSPGDYYVRLIFKKFVNGDEQLYDQKMEWVHIAPGLTTTNTVSFTGDNTPYLISYQAKKMVNQQTGTMCHGKKVLLQFILSIPV